MPQLVIKIVDRGTKITDSVTNHISSSQTGHMWFELVDDNGSVTSYGFAPDPDNQGKPFAPGSLYTDDNIKYDFSETNSDYQRPFEITQSQFETLENGDETDIFADKAYDNKDIKRFCRNNNIFCGITSKATSSKKLLNKQKKKNKQSSSVRAKVEHSFQIIKHQWNYRKTRYRGLQKNTNQLQIL